MKVAEPAKNEKARLKALASYHVLDTLPEQDFDDLTLLASHICNTPVALISLIDESRQWFKSKVGVTSSETPRDVAFCAHAILQDDVFVVPDSRLDERFLDNPLVTDFPNVRFYAGAPLMTPDGNNIGTLCVIDTNPRQITKEQEAALEALARQVVSQLELRRHIAESDQTQREMAFIKDAAMTAARTKSEFLANMSHEIRTPMNGVMGMTQLLLEEVKDETLASHLRVIQNCGTTLMHLINDILDFTKIEADKLIIESEPFDLLGTVNETTDLYKSVASQKGLTLSSVISSSVPSWVRGDITRLKQIINNLVNNSIKFTERGEVRLEVDARLYDNENHELQITVHDTGIGMNEEAMTKLFRSFSQVDASTSRRFGGTGLGLAICKGLCEKMGGRIWVESTPGVGSSFYFTIVVGISETLRTATSEKAFPTDFKLAALHPLRILLAEDNHVNQLVAKGFLKKLGYQIDIAENGLEVLEKMRLKTYDLILMDCHMPEMDGLEATQHICASFERNERPHIVAMTAKAFKDDKARCLEAGMDGFISKPFTVSDLMQCLRNCPRRESADAEKTSLKKPAA